VGRFFVQSPGGLSKTRTGTLYQRTPDRQTRGTAFIRLWSKRTRKNGGQGRKDFFFKVREVSKNSGVSPSFW
jgi:hypothetical protein